jgi:hypothetical protein
MGPDKGRGLGLQSAWFYAFFISQNEFTEHLPLDTPEIDVSPSDAKRVIPLP